MGEVDNCIFVSTNNEIEDVFDPIKQRSCHQRAALSDEPQCVVCGRYGEYICDETEDDICSIECKHVLLNRLATNQKPAISTSTVKIPATNECCYVSANCLPEQNHASYDEVESLRKKLDIHIKGGTLTPPLLSFASCNIPKKLQDNLESSGYEMPTPVQMQVIPAVFAGRNLLVAAGTGSGKTASFLIPTVCHCSDLRTKHPDCSKPLAMVLVPTRELCVQLEEQAKLLGKGLPFKTALVVGGDCMSGQLHRIGQGVELIVGTPGRLIDILSKHEIELNQVSMLIIDEVDCMLQRGFRSQVLQIFWALSQPQLLMFSATISQEVEKMAKLLAHDLTFVVVGRPNTPNNAVQQVAIWVESKQKKQKLFEILTSKQHFKPPTVVFVGSRYGADLLCEAITVKIGLRAVSLHGEKTMKERRESLNLFLTGDVVIMVTTGVLGRGVDLLNVRQVVVFDMPNSIKEYVHQIGRASRFGEQGTAILFINDEDKKLFRELIENLKLSGAAVPRELANSQYAAVACSSSKNSRKRKPIAS